MNFRAKSSSGGTYLMSAEISEGRLSITCECRAGIFGQLCRHQLALIDGDSRVIEGNIESLHSNPAFIQFLEAYREYQEAIKQIQKQITELKNREKALKRSLAGYLS